MSPADAAFDTAFHRTVGKEGGYSNHPSDSGGETMFGITIAVARANGYHGPMRDMPVDFAKRVYRLEYWEALKLSDIAEVVPFLALELFDTAVNVGIDFAGRILQRALNVLNKRGSLYSDIKVDGRVGGVTVQAFRQLCQQRGQRDAGKALFRICDSLQGAKYVGLAEAREKDEDFIFGWALHRLGSDAQ